MYRRAFFKIPKPDIVFTSLVSAKSQFVRRDIRIYIYIYILFSCIRFDGKCLTNRILMIGIDRKKHNPYHTFSIYAGKSVTPDRLFYADLASVDLFFEVSLFPMISSRVILFFSFLEIWQRSSYSAIKWRVDSYFSNRIWSRPNPFH